MVWEKLCEVFQPTTREGNEVELVSEIRTLGKLLVGVVEDGAEEVTVGPADVGREVFRIFSALDPLTEPLV